PGCVDRNSLISTPKPCKSGCSRANVNDGVYDGLTRAGRLVNWDCVLNVMPAVPPVGNGLGRLLGKGGASVLMELRAPARPAWKASRAVPIGRSVVFQIRLLVKKASNLDRAESMPSALMAGLRARTRMLSEKSGPPGPPKPWKRTR